MDNENYQSANEYTNKAEYKDKSDYITKGDYKGKFDYKGKSDYKDKGNIKGDKIPFKKPRYNEKETTSKFLLSEKGFPFLLSIGKAANFGSQNIIEEIDKLIDFYSCWTSSFPVRKNLKVSKYDFLKSVEDFCAKKENALEIQPLFESQSKYF